MPLTGSSAARLKTWTRFVFVVVAIASLCLTCLPSSLLEPWNISDKPAVENDGTGADYLTVPSPGSLVASTGPGKPLISKPAHEKVQAVGSEISLVIPPCFRAGMQCEMQSRFRIALLALLDRGPPSLPVL